MADFGTERKLANTFTLDELRKQMNYLIDRRCKSVQEANYMAGYATTGAYYRSLKNDGLAGINQLKSILETLGYSVEFYVQVKDPLYDRNPRPTINPNIVEFRKQARKHRRHWGKKKLNG